MITTMPTTVVEAWGNQVAGDFMSWPEGVLSESTVRRADWAEVQLRLGVIEHDVADIKADLRGFSAQVGSRFAALDARLDHMSTSFDQRIDRLSADFNQRFDALQRQMAMQTRWAIGLLSLFVAITSMLFGLVTLGR